MMRFFRPPNSVHDVSISCLICHKFKCGFHALPRMARTLVEPVLGTSTKMHLYLWQITSARLLFLNIAFGARAHDGKWVGRDSNPKPTPKAFGADLTGASSPLSLMRKSPAADSFCI